MREKVIVSSFATFTSKNLEHIHLHLKKKKLNFDVPSLIFVDVLT